MPLTTSLNDYKRTLESVDGNAQLTIPNGGTAQYVLPHTAGTAGQALKASATPATLEWGAAGGDAFKTISVAGQSDVVADNAADTLTLVAGSNISMTTNAGADSITIASALQNSDG